jgi:DNA replication protein DnaC
MSHLIEQSIPPLYQSWQLQDLVGPDNIKEIQQNVSQYLNDPSLEKNGNNLYVYSVENGSGKTSIAYYILGEIHKPRYKKIMTADDVWSQSTLDITPIIAVKFANYLKFCNDPYNQDSKNAKRQVETAPFLLLDDVSPWALSSNLHKDKTELVLLMMYRREHLLPTIITSNLVPTEFDKVFGATVASKVLENFSYVEVKGGDVRPAIYPDQFNEDPEIVMKQEIEMLKEAGEH